MLSFRAKAKGGVTPLEISRRTEAALAAAPMRELPPPLPRFEPPPAPELRLVAEPEPEPAAPPEEAMPAEPSSSEVKAFVPDNPVVTITVSGLSGTGKTALVHLIRQTLAHEGIAFDGPAGLVSLRWHRSLDWHVRRGLRVILVEAEEEALPEDADG